MGKPQFLVLACTLFLEKKQSNWGITFGEELREKAGKGEATVEDAMAALMLAAIMKKESKED